MRRDPVTPELWRAVVERDQGCVAPRLGATDPCGDRWGTLPTGEEREKALAGYYSGFLTLDHVKDEPRMGKRAPSDMAHLVTVCWRHHLGGWATAHRAELREYLAVTRALALARFNIEPGSVP